MRGHLVVLLNNLPAKNPILPRTLFAVQPGAFIVQPKRGRKSIGPSFGFEVFVPGRLDASA